MNSESINLLFDYNYWAIRRILNAVEKLTAEQYVQVMPGLSMGSVRGTLVHTLAAEHIWRLRGMESQSPTSLIREDDLPAFEQLRRVWAEEETAIRTGLARLTDAALVGRLSYLTTNGKPMAETLWQLLAHLVNHGTQHRAEAAVALTAFGHSPGDVDMIVYMRR